jgi:hypothetical protein
VPKEPVKNLNIVELGFPGAIFKPRAMELVPRGLSLHPGRPFWGCHAWDALRFYSMHKPQISDPPYITRASIREGVLNSRNYFRNFGHVVFALEYPECPEEANQQLEFGSPDAPSQVERCGSNPRLLRAHSRTQPLLVSPHSRLLQSSSHHNIYPQRDESSKMAGLRPIRLVPSGIVPS